LRSEIATATILHMERNAQRRPRVHRGFTMVELMIVVALASVLATMAIPYYQKLTARAHRAEMQAVLSKLRLQMINTYQNAGQFPLPTSGTTSTWNPVDPVSGTPAVGQPAVWNTADADWTNLPSVEGSVRMRYQYTITNAGTTLTLTAQGSFPGITGTYSYVETWNGANPAGAPVEFPAF
jgi:prepilin-type N-terminal cleavage/methylation domain-containing protein